MVEQLTVNQLVGGSNPPCGAIPIIMSKVLIISDLHFGHETLAISRGFKNAQEQDELIINNWNRVVNKRDTIWILGDITMETNKHYYLLDELYGRKKVILGNHDLPKHVPDLLKHVEQVGGAVKYKGNILTHIPINTHEIDRFRRNIHGHLHEEIIEHNKYINVCCEQLDYTPVEFDKLFIS